MPRWLRIGLAFLLAPTPMILLGTAIAASRPAEGQPVYGVMIGGFILSWLLQAMPGLLFAIPAWRSGRRRWWRWALAGAATYGGAALVFMVIRATLGRTPIVVVIVFPIFVALIGAACGVVARLILGSGNSPSTTTALEQLRQTFD
jgi:drug/metabolite transporter (DMT)-like permease